MSTVKDVDVRPLTDKYRNLSSGPVNIHEAVSSPDYFIAEREAIFKSGWVMLGRVAELPNPGDFFVKSYETLETSILVVRNKKGEINAFHNVCVHRGMTLCGKNVKKGCKKYFACPFHGWVYDADGQLVDVPDRQFFDEDDLKKLALKKITMDIWEGFIFINLSPQPSESLKEYLGEIFDQYRGYFDDEKFSLVNRYSMKTKMNWKFYLDSSIEAYHAAVVHLQNNTGQNKQSNTVLHVAPEAVRLFRRHRTIGVPSGLGERKLSPMEALSFQYGATTPYDVQAGGADMPPGINANKDPGWAFDILEIVPNIVLFISAPLYAVISLWPSSEKECLYEADVYMSKPGDAAARVALEYGLLSLRDVLREDINTAEGITTMTSAGVLKDYVFSDQEIAVRHSYAVIDEMVQNWLASR